jgi:hypothetical protein
MSPVPDLLPEFTASARFSGNASGPLVFSDVPASGASANLAPFFKGDRGERGATGDAGPVGPTGLYQTGPIIASATGAQALALAVEPTPGGFMQVFINGVLHLDTGDYSVAGLILTLTEVVGVLVGDRISIVYQ